MTGPANPETPRRTRHFVRSKSRERDLTAHDLPMTGVEREHVLAEKSHLDEFTCALCNKMASLDAYTTIPCAHPFCKQCFENWLEGKQTKTTCVCPSCGTIISDVPGAPTAIKPDSMLHYKGHQVAARPMSQAQPLAHRILKKVKVLCPLRNKRSCTWTGDHRDLKAHMATHNSRSPQSPTRRNSNDTGRARSSSREPNPKNMNPRSRPSPLSRTPKPPNRRSSIELSPPKVNRELRRSQSMMVGERGREGRYPGKFQRARSPVPEKLSQSLPPRNDELDDSNNSRRLSDLALRRTKSLHDIDSPVPMRHGPSTGSPQGRSSPSAPLSNGSHSSNHSQSSQSRRRDEANQQQQRRRSQGNQRRQSFLGFAYAIKEKANASFKAGRYEEATTFYTEAINAYSNRARSDEEDELIATLFSNRAASFLRMNQYELCIKDCDCAIRLNQYLMKAYLRKCWAHIEMGNLEEANECLKSGFEKNPQAKELETEMKSLERLQTRLDRVMKLVENEDHEAAMNAVRAIDHYKSNIRVRLVVASVDLCLGNVDEVLKHMDTILLERSDHVQALEIRAQAHLLNADFTNAVADVKAALGHDPNSDSVQKSLRKHLSVQRNVLDARKAVYASNLTKAIALYTAAIDDCKPLSSKTELYKLLRSERGEVYYSLGEYDASLVDTQNALLCANDYTVAWVTRVRALQALGRYSDIQRELEPVISVVGEACDFLVKAYEEAKSGGSKAPQLFKQRVDYYAVFGVKFDANEDEIRKQYRLKAKECHPDRFMSNKYSDQERKQAEEKFKTLGEGLEVLCDPFRRKLYDSGLDIDSIRAQGDAADRRSAAESGDETL